LKELHQNINLNANEWDHFLLEYTGDVDAIVATKTGGTENRATSLTGTTPATAVDNSGTFLLKTANPANTPLAILEAEIGRLKKLVAADKETAQKLSAVSKRIAEETTALERLKEKLADCEGARDRATNVVVDREQSYVRVFGAVLGEERVLKALYALLMARLKAAGGTLAKLSFTVSRVANIAKWAKRGEEELFDLRGGPFKGFGTLAKEANGMLENDWTSGNSAEVSFAMSEFIKKHHIPERTNRTTAFGRGASRNGSTAQITY